MILFISASFLQSTTILKPCLSDSSLIAEIPSILLSFTKSAMYSINFALFTWYGSEDTIILCFPPH